MPIPLEEKRVKLPTVKHDEPGQTAVLMFVDMAVVQKRKYGTQDLDTREDGTVKEQDLLTVLVLPGSNCTLSDPDSDDENARIPATPGTLAQVYYAGHKRWEYVQAKKAYKLGVMVGDVLVDRFEGTTRVGINGAKLTQDKKLHKIGVRAARDAELPYIAEAERLWNERRQTTRPVLASAPADVTYDESEEPF